MQYLMYISINVPNINKIWVIVRKKNFNQNFNQIVDVTRPPNRHIPTNANLLAKIFRWKIWLKIRKCLTDCKWFLRRCILKFRQCILFCYFVIISSWKKAMTLHLKQEANGLYRSLDHKRLFTNFLSKGFIIAYQEAQCRVHWYTSSISYKS